MSNVAYLPREERRGAHGRRCGEHGNRVPELIQRQVRAELADAVRNGRRLPTELVERAMQLTGATRRTIQRWADEERRRLITGLDEQPGGLSADERLLGLRKVAAGEQPKFRMTPALIEEVASFPSVAKAYATLHDTPGHPAESVGRSTFYAALAEVHPAVKHGRTKGPRKMREHEMHLQRVRQVVRVNELWGTDEFDTKVNAVYQGRVVAPEVVSFRDEATGLPIGYVVLPGAASSDDVVALFGSCVLGWAADGVQVSGAPRRVRCDQGAPFLGEDTRRRLAFFGTTLDPSASYNPQANGAQERFQRDLLGELKRHRGSRRVPEDRTGRAYEDELPTFEEVCAAVDAVMANRRFVHKPVTGRNARRTALDVYRQRQEEGRVERLDADDVCIAETAIPLRGLRTNEPRKGVFVRGEYFTSYALAVWNRHEDVQVRLLPDHPEMAFVFDDAGKFVATVWHPDALPAEDAHAIVQLRQDREGWMHGVQRRVAAARAVVEGVPGCDDGGVPVAPTVPTPSSPPPAAPADPEALAHAPELRGLLNNPVLLTALRSLTAEQLAELRAAVGGDPTDGTTRDAGPAADAPAGETPAAEPTTPAGRQLPTRPLPTRQQPTPTQALVERLTDPIPDEDPA